MSLKQKQEFFIGTQRVVHGTPEVAPVDIDVSEDHSARIVVDLVGRDGLSTGTWNLELFGILGEVVTTVPIGTMTGAATGLTQAIESDLVDVRGFDKIRISFSYDRVVTDFVNVHVWAGISHQHGVQSGT